LKTVTTTLARIAFTSTSGLALSLAGIGAARAQDGMDDRESIVVTAQKAGVLQLAQPAEGSSRLGLTPMETPASVDCPSSEHLAQAVA